MTDDELDELALEALDELDSYYAYEKIKPSDITGEMLATRWGCHKSTVNERMKKLVDRGLYHRIRVVDDRGYLIYVYRKGAQPE